MSVRDLNDAPRLLAPIADYFSRALERHGATPAGVLWRDDAGQRLRFTQLIGIFDDADRRGGVTINDLGCGYGALFDFLADRPEMAGGSYVGYDICADMLAHARRRITDSRASFVESLRATQPADYALISGTHNLKLDTRDAEWEDFVHKSLIDTWATSRKGLAFNMLGFDRTRRPQASLYYADPMRFYDFCQRHLSSDVTLVHDYPLAEWTMWVRA
ncbi:MAG: class I SAM-dependent methyltransferase [Rhodospirillales bacterium]|jgi:SAM-dependent methyltransferase|nr:class I SAM-dependent methyltransferase [Rhodospirillales bacterium]MDP6805055.1 class I SAM-dependent methyltransferase [Rhodospirillales bacterium]